MGSTVTTGRVAAVFRAHSGVTIYCLFEKTYEKNCHPHIPRWSPVYIGDASGAVGQVFDYASMCEGGMLQNRSGRITPEGYLRTWIAELQSPARMQDCSIQLYAKTDSYRAPLSTESIPGIAAVLAANGLDEAAGDLLQAGEYRSRSTSTATSSAGCRTTTTFTPGHSCPTPRGHPMTPSAFRFSGSSLRRRQLLH